MLGKRLKELRLEAGISQEKLAEMLNLSQQTIGHYEVDRSEPSIKTLEMLARIFHTSTDYLLGLSNVRHPQVEYSQQIYANLPENAIREIADFAEFIKKKYEDD